MIKCFVQYKIEFKLITITKYRISMYNSNQYSSPYQRQSTKNQSPEEEPIESLDKYLNVPIGESYSDKLRKDIVLAEIQSINSQLSNICKEKMGDLTLGFDQGEQQWVQIQKTIKLIKNLISIYHRDSEAKKDLNTKLRRSQEQISKQNAMYEKISKEKRTIEKEKQNLQLKLKSQERQYKQDITQSRKQKQESQKKFNQIQNKENQYKNQARKYQQIIAELQQKIKSKNGDKNTVKNRFERIEEVKNYGPSLIWGNGQNQFNKFFTGNFEAAYRAIVEENQYLKKTLQNMYKQLHQLLEIKKQVIKRRKGFESALDNDTFEFENVNVETFNLPKEFSQDTMQKLYTNLQKFKQAMKVNQMVSEKVQDQKIQCINNVKNLLGNYKEIVESQDKLINRVVLKSKQFKSNEMTALENKYNKSVQSDQFEKSKRFLEEQRQILLNRNKELQIARKAMKNTIKKAEEERKNFEKKKIQTNEQLVMLKKNVQKLPAMIQQEITNMM